MKKYLQALLAAVCLSLVASLGMAADLTDKHVQNYIASLKALDALEADEEDFDGWFDALGEGEGDEPVTMAEVIERSKGAPVYGKVEKIVQKNGFSSLADWATTADQVNAAYMRILMGDAQEMEKELAEVRAELDAMPDISAEQKQAILAMANEAAQVVEAMTKEVSEADIAVVERHLEALNEVLDDE